MEQKRHVWDKHERDWDGSFNFVLITYIVIMLAFILVRMVAGFGWLSPSDPYNYAHMRAVDIGFGIVSQILIMTAIPVAAMFFWRRRRARHTGKGLDNSVKSVGASFGFDKPNLKVIGFAVILGIIAFFFNIFVSALFNGILSFAGFRNFSGGFEHWSGIGALFALLTLVAVLPGFCEEVTHRGMLLRSFTPRLGVMRAIMLSSIMFGFMHLNIVQVFYAAILGYIIALATVATKSLWTGVIMHFLNNGIGIYLSLASRPENNWPLGNLFDSISGIFNIFGIFVYVIVIWGGLYLMLAIIRMFAQDNYTKNKAAHIGAIIRANPDIIKHNDRILTIEELTIHADTALQKLGNWQKLKFYLDPVHASGKRPAPLNRLESTLLCGVLFLGGIITLFTMVWGFL